jgi:deoxyribodipyrimidine photo-lyase
MKINFFWFRRDLRLLDNSGLYHALRSGNKVLPVFIFDSNILDELTDKTDARVTFIFDTVQSLKKEIQHRGGDLEVRYGEPLEIWKQLASEFDIESVYTNHDFESYALRRDKRVSEFLSTKGINFLTFKDHVIFEKSEVVKDDGKPYTIFTPYKRKWIEKLHSKALKTESDFFYFSSYPSDQLTANFLIRNENINGPALGEMGFNRTDIEIPSPSINSGKILKYDKTRDFPSLDATSHLGLHFRFGTISIREKARKAYTLNHVFLNELIWRDFYAQILFHFPHVEKGAFRPEYDSIEWKNDEADFEAWREGKTGYPIVDAGMRQLASTGFMHNRVRMITASFLTKHLLIDWRWGEAWFAQKLLDFDLASNNGGWQWAAGCGTDAAPYFRIFNPQAQTDKFDKDYAYIKKWVPEFGTTHYAKPIVDHKHARERCLEVYKKGIANGKM